MPAFPCVACKNLVDTNDVVCRKCNDKQPFECSKCGARLAAQDIFEVEKLTFKKSLFCRKCGQENAVVQCAQCNTSIIRSVGHKRTGSGGSELVYHEDCWKQYEKQDRITRQIMTIWAPVAAVVVIALGGWMYHDAVKGLTMGVATAVVIAVVGFVARPKG
jgi:hypothetical protein